LNPIQQRLFELDVQRRFAAVCLGDCFARRASDAALEFWESLAISNPQFVPTDDYGFSNTNDMEGIMLH
jgi:hypothetical protein